jgi:hypothetical protein
MPTAMMALIEDCSAMFCRLPQDRKLSVATIMKTEIATSPTSGRKAVERRSSVRNPPAGAGGAGWLAVAFMANPLWLRGA